MKKKNVQVQMLESTYDSVTSLQNILQAKTKSETVKVAIDLAYMVANTIQNGGEVILRDKAGLTDSDTSSESESNDVNNEWLVDTLMKHGGYKSRKETIAAALETAFQKAMEDDAKNWDEGSKTGDDAIYSQLDLSEA
ncbi:MAG: hypothetical protein HC840_00865 [Leptolyngbyaceae cyanobacterium RM2_2_4]|nr:hypothetical protein [Leptolyngbyaceae cyanobacterium RM2_2_4]